jgi:hypothetical protein
MAVKNEWGLTPQQEKFAREIAGGKSQSDAYRASYKAGRMTAKQIHEEACKLAANPKVSQRRAHLAQKVEQVFVVDTAKLLRETDRLAHSNVANILHPDGRVKLPNELDPDTAAAVASFKIDEYGRIEYKFWDKNSAQERLFKHKGLFKEDNEQSTPTVFAKIELVGVRPKPEPGKA